MMTGEIFHRQIITTTVLANMEGSSLLKNRRNQFFIRPSHELACNVSKRNVQNEILRNFASVSSLVTDKI
jgi:hypothetical protein